MNKILFFIFFLLSFCLSGQNEDSLKSNNELWKEQKYNLEKVEIRVENYRENADNKIAHLETRVNNKIDNVDSKYGYYLIFGGVLLSILVFFTTYFGRSYINTRVESIIKKTASLYSEKAIDNVLKKYTDDGIIDKLIVDKGELAIENIIAKIEKKGVIVIDDIKERGDKAISSMTAKQEEYKIEDTFASTDEEIKKASKESRVREFFDLAFTNKDALIQIELYKTVLEIEPNHIEALNNIGVAYNNAYNYDEAIKYFNKCIKISPKYALPYANLANSYNLKDELNKASKFVNKAMKLNPKLDWSYSVKGNILTKEGKLDEAEEIFGKAIELNPKSPEAYFSRGYFYEEIGKHKASIKDYDMALNLGFQNLAMLYNNFAVVFRRQRKFKKAIKYLEKARKENPNFPNIDGTLALIYADQKDRDNFYKFLIIALDKGCQAWKYIDDSGFDEYRDEDKLIKLLNSYRKKYEA